MKSLQNCMNIQLIAFTCMSLNSPNILKRVWRKNHILGFMYQNQSGHKFKFHIERYYGTVKHIYFKGKNIQRLDRYLHCLQKYTGDRKIEYLIAKERGPKKVLSISFVTLVKTSILL